MKEKKEHVATREVSGRHELYVGDRCVASCGSEASLKAARSLIVGKSDYDGQFPDILENL